MNRATELPVFDADQHYYEPLDAFTRHLSPAWGPRTVQQAYVDGRVRFLVGGRVNRTVSNPTFDPIVKPGAMTSFFRGNPEEKTLEECLAEREPIPAFYRDRDARIARLDEQEVERAWLLPTIAMAYEEDLQFDPEACGVAFQAFNEWLLEDWPFVYQDRIYSSPYLAMGDRDAAVRSVEWALGKGARIFVVRPSGTFTSEGRWRSPGDPWFDPIWARINEAGVTVVPHVAEVGGFGLERYVSHGVGIISHAPPPLQVAVGHERPIANYLAALVCDRLFERFPRLRIASVENGAEFLPLVRAGLRRAGFQRPGYFAEDPFETFLRHVWVAPFWEDDLEDAVRLIGAERILFGSDWPHPEGMAEPRDYDKVVANLGNEKAERQIMYRNTLELTQPL